MSVLRLGLGFLGSGVWRVDSFSQPDLDLLAGLGITVAHIDLSEVDSKHKLLGVLSSELGFPEWFGENWDALADCLGAWGAGDRTHLLAIEGLDTLAKADPASYQTLVDILIETFNRPSATGPSALLACAPDERLADLPPQPLERP